MEILKLIIPAKNPSKLLLLFTTKSVFQSHEETLFLQVDGTGTNLPFGPVFANCAGLQKNFPRISFQYSVSFYPPEYEYESHFFPSRLDFSKKNMTKV